MYGNTRRGGIAANSPGNDGEDDVDGHDDADIGRQNDSRVSARMYYRREYRRLAFTTTQSAPSVPMREPYWMPDVSLRTRELRNERR